MDSETLRKYFLSYENMLKTVRYRGYTVPETLLLTKEAFSIKYIDFESVDDIKEDIGDLVFEKGGENNANDTEGKNTKGKVGNVGKILLRWVKDKKFGPSIRDVTNTLRDNNINRALIVSDEGINPASKGVLGNLKVCYGLIIDVWTLQESMIFPPDHVYTPKHRICTLREKKSLYNNYGLKDKDLPRIKPDDVMVKYLGATRKQLIEITRRSDTNPELYILYYRIVL